MTELPAAVATNPVWCNKHGSVGLLLSNCQAKVLSTDGQLLECNQVCYW